MVGREVSGRSALTSHGAKRLLRQTISVVRGGGMLTANGKRKRTAGGTFFALVKAEMEPEKWRALPAEVELEVLEAAPPMKVSVLPTIRPCVKSAVVSQPP